MALTKAQKQKIKEEEEYRLQVAAGAQTKTVKQTYGFAALLSFFIPGLGQIIKGQLGRGIGFFFGTLLAFVTIIGGPIVWIWAVADAYNKPTN